MTRLTPTRKLAREQSSSPLDSPSRQLLREMSLLQLHEAELNKVAAYQQHAFYEDLNRRSAEQAEIDRAALKAVAARRESIRHEAEAVLQAHIREEEEKAQRRRAERARLEAEAARKAAEEEARAQAEERARWEREETAKREQEAERERIAKEEEEKAKKKQADAARKADEEKTAKESADAAQKAANDEAARAEADRQQEAASKAQSQPTLSPQPQSQPQTRPQTLAPTSSPIGATPTANEALHNRYLAIHARLKPFRSTFWANAKTDLNLKTKVGDMRRSIRTAVGQLTEHKGENSQATARVRSTLQLALTIPSPPVDVREFLAHHPPTNLQSYTVPSLMIYILSIFAKATIARFTGEGAVNPASVEPAGVLLAYILSIDEFQFNGIPLIDILLAKFHAACPVLWGIYGSESTPTGKKRIGWRIEDHDGTRTFVSEERHTDRMTGLGAGFAAIALRNFAKARSANPFPPKNYWESLSNIVNVPPHEVQQTHLVVLRAMIENATERFILFFDGAAVAALRFALVEFPQRLPEALRRNPACKALEQLLDVLKEKNLTLV